MSDSRSAKLKELFREAADIASVVPEPMKSDAFNRALDLLTSQRVPALTSDKSSESRSSRTELERGGTDSRAVGSTKQIDSAKGSSGVKNLIHSVDTTQYPEMVRAQTALARGLIALDIGLHHGVDGMTPGEISEFLVDKFRLNVSDAAVRMALGKASDLVDRVPEGKAYKYRIMAPGQEHVRKLRKAPESKNSKSRATKKTQAKKGTATRKANAAKEKTPPKSSRTPSARGTSGGRLGPMAMIRQLVEKGYFSEPRQVSEVLHHLEVNYARTYKSSDLTPAFARLIRTDLLSRSRTENGKFQYVAQR